MRYLLDSDICIFYFRGDFNLARKIDSIGVENCFVSEISLLELTFGAYNSNRFEKHIAEAQKLEELFKILPIRPVKDIFGKERKRLKDTGNQIPNFDLLIGCTSVHKGITMVTRNVKHFERIEGIQIEDWTDEAFNEFI